ncbi:MAG: tetratricopeptide repeat protein [Anaeromyxobacteraceae bacterium]
MKTTPKLQWMLDELARGLELDRSDKAAAMQVYRSVLVEAERLGVDSAYLRWVVAVTHDELGALEMAWEELEKSIAADPLSLPARRSFEIIADRVRAALRAPERAVDDPSTPRLYALLIRAGEADLGAHVAMARFELAAGRAAEARGLADAVVRLFPASREAWSLLADVARAQGDAVTAASAGLEAASAGALEPMFGVFGQAKA